MVHILCSCICVVILPWQITCNWDKLENMYGKYQWKILLLRQIKHPDELPIVVHYTIKPRTYIVGGQWSCDYSIYGNKLLVNYHIWYNHRATVQVFMSEVHILHNWTLREDPRSGTNDGVTQVWIKCHLCKETLRRTEQLYWCHDQHLGRVLLLCMVLLIKIRASKCSYYCQFN